MVAPSLNKATIINQAPYSHDPILGWTDVILDSHWDISESLKGIEVMRIVTLATQDHIPLIQELIRKWICPAVTPALMQVYLNEKYHGF